MGNLILTQGFTLSPGIERDMKSMLETPGFRALTNAYDRGALNFKQDGSNLENILGALSEQGGKVNRENMAELLRSTANLGHLGDIRQAIAEDPKLSAELDRRPNVKAAIEESLDTIQRRASEFRGRLLANGNAHNGMTAASKFELDPDMPFGDPKAPKIASEIDVRASHEAAVAVGEDIPKSRGRGVAGILVGAGMGVFAAGNAMASGASIEDAAYLGVQTANPLPNTTDAIVGRSDDSVALGSAKDFYDITFGALVDGGISIREGALHSIDGDNAQASESYRTAALGTLSAVTAGISEIVRVDLLDHRGYDESREDFDKRTSILNSPEFRELENSCIIPTSITTEQRQFYSNLNRYLGINEPSQPENAMDTAIAQAEGVVNSDIQVSDAGSLDGLNGEIIAPSNPSLPSVPDAGTPMSGRG